VSCGLIVFTKKNIFQLDLKKEKLNAYDSCNALALPSKKIKFSQTKKKQLQQRPFLSKKKRKELEKIVAVKEKKKNVRFKFQSFIF